MGYHDHQGCQTRVAICVGVKETFCCEVYNEAEKKSFCNCDSVCVCSVMYVLRFKKQLTIKA